MGTPAEWRVFKTATSGSTSGSREHRRQMAETDYQAVLDLGYIDLEERTL